MQKYTPEIEKRLIELATSKHSESQIAEIINEEYKLGVTRNGIHNKLRTINFNQLLEKPKPENMPYYNKYIDFYEGGKEPTPKTFSCEYPYSIVEPKDLKILCLNDLHVPFQIDEHIQQAVNQHYSYDMLILSEVADCYSLSRFNKEMTVPLSVEIENCIRLFEYFSAIFPRIIVIETNHSLRVEKQVQRNLPEELLFLIETHMLKRLAAPFPNIVVVPSWYVQVNDTIFCHAETASKVDLKAATNVYGFFMEWKKQLRMPEFRCILQSHTHKLGTTYRGGGAVKIFETGCMCYQPAYALANMYPNPQINGYINVVQKGGHVDFNQTRENYFSTPAYKVSGRFFSHYEEK